MLSLLARLKKILAGPRELINDTQVHHRSQVQDLVGTVLSIELPTSYHHNSIIVESWLVCVEGRGRISRSGLTQDIKMGSCVFQCDVRHQWIAQRQVDPVSVYCDGVGCHVLCLPHGIPVWQHIGTTATSRLVSWLCLTSHLQRGHLGTVVI